MNSEIASPTSSSVGGIAADTTRILEGSANAWFKGNVGLGEVVVDAMFADRSVPDGGASAISLRTGTERGFVWGFEMFTGAEAVVAVKSADFATT